MHYSYDKLWKQVIHLYVKSCQTLRLQSRSLVIIQMGAILLGSIAGLGFVFVKHDGKEGSDGSGV